MGGRGREGENERGRGREGERGRTKEREDEKMREQENERTRGRGNEGENMNFLWDIFFIYIPYFSFIFCIDLLWRRFILYFLDYRSIFLIFLFILFSNNIIYSYFYFLNEYSYSNF